MTLLRLGNAVVDTDEVISQGYDFIGLKIAGMLKVQKLTVLNDLIISGKDKWYPPGTPVEISGFVYASDIYLSNPNITVGES